MARAFAILFALLVQGADAEGFNPATYGAVYGKADPASVAANDAAVAEVLKRIAANNGGEMVLRGSLAISKTISPPTVVLNRVPGFPAHFSIRGSIDAELYDVDGGIAIDFPQPLSPANQPSRDLRCSLERIAVRHGSVRIQGAVVELTGWGKYLTLRDVRIYDVKDGFALDVEGYDGGNLDRVNIHNCGGTGLRLASSHQTHVDVTCRENNIGARIEDCGALYGALYCESNKGLGMDAESLARSHLALWLEGNNGGAWQGQRRNCYSNVFSGLSQSDSNEAWDDDTLSRIANIETSSLRVFDRFGTQEAVAYPNRTTFPQTAVVTPLRRVTIKPGAFAASTNASGAPNWVELQPPGADNCGAAWEAGDVLVLYIQVQPDPSTKAWYAAHPKCGLLFTAGCVQGKPPKISQLWSPAGDDTLCIALGTCTEAGSGLRVFCFPGSDQPGPDRELNLTITAEVRKVSQ